MSGRLLLSLIIFEAVFVSLFSLFTSTTCSLGLQPVFTPLSTAGVDGTLIGVLIGLGNILIFVINGFITIGQLFTGIGLGCGYPTWFVSIFQIPILVTIIYLCIPFVK